MNTNPMTQHNLSPDNLAAHQLYLRLTGQLTPLQKDNVAMWPKIAWHEVASVETRIDVEQHHITYVLELVKPKKQKKKNKEIKDFETGVRWVESFVWALFGDEWHTTFQIGHKVLYRGDTRERTNVSKSSETPKPQGA